MTRIGMLGPVTVDGAPVTAIRRRRLLALLALAEGEPVTGDRLVDGLWEADLPADPIAALQTTVSRLRRDLPSGVRVETTPHGYRLVVEGEDAVDTVGFEQRLDAGEPAAALALWRGDPYEDLDTDRARAERARLEERRLEAREAEAAGLLDEGRAAEAGARLEALVADCPLREAAVGLLMQARYMEGRQGEALAVYGDLRTRLVEELGIDPSPDLQELEGRILRQDPDVAPQPRSAPTRADPPESAVRPSVQPASSLVGRDDELADLVRQLGAERLLTLTGPGGVGKTRLALSAADALAPDHPDGVWVVELGEVTEPSLVAEAAATTLGVPRQGEATPSERLSAFVDGRRALLVLDNCEHVIDAAAELADTLLRSSTSIRVLATSREPLRVAGERRVPVHPLHLTEDGEDPAPAIDLFCRRAAAVDPEFTPDGPEQQAIVSVCTRLDGLPLAIELAAAQVSHLTVTEIDRALDERFDLLDRGLRTAPSRHGSLRAVVESSYDLLGEEDRELFEALCVFAGGFTRAAVAQVAGPAGARQVGALVERSLVSRAVAPGSTSELRVLETLREYGRERARHRGTWPALQDRHAGWAVDLAADSRALLASPDEPEAQRALDRSVPDLRAAHRHLLDVHSVDRLLRLSHELHLWAWPRLQPEVLSWAEAAADASAGSGHPLVSSVFGSAAVGAWQRGDLKRSVSLAERGLQETGDHPQPGRHRCHTALGDVALFKGELASARGHYERAVHGAEANGAHDDLSGALCDLALALGYSDEPERAEALLDRADRLAATAGAPGLRGWATYARGEILARRDPAAAIPVLERALRQAEDADADFVIGVAGLTWLTARARGLEPAASLGEFRRLLERWWQVGAWTQLWPTMRNLADTFARAGQAHPAAVLLGAQGAPGTPEVYGDDAELMAEVERRLRRDLGEDFESVHTEGLALDGPAAVAFALEALVAADR